MEDIKAFEKVLRKHQLSFEEQGLLALKYRRCITNCFGTDNDPIKSEAIMSSCAALSRFMLSRNSALPPLLLPSDQRLFVRDRDLEKKVKEDKKLQKEQEAEFKRQQKEDKKKDKKKDKKDKKGKKKKKDKKGKKKDKKKKDKKGKKGKKDKKNKKDKKQEKKEKKLAKKLAQEKADRAKASAKLVPFPTVSEQFDKFALISAYLSASDRSISQFVPCLKFTETCPNNVSDEQKAECQVLRNAAEFQLRSEECWRSYLSQVRHCRYANDPKACLQMYTDLEAECSIYGLEAFKATEAILTRE